MIIHSSLNGLKMNYRYMRIIVFFDLPVTLEKSRREANRFRKYLIKSGFLMMQESVYCKLVQNDVAALTIIDSLKKNKPNDGLVQVLKVTEKQFSRMIYLVGKKKTEVIETDERIVIL